MAENILGPDILRHINTTRIKTERPAEESAEGNKGAESAEDLRREFNRLTPEEKEALRTPPPLEDITIPWTDGTRHLNPGDSVIHRIPR